MKKRLQAWSGAAWVAAIGLLATVIGGTWWVAMAIQMGEPITAVSRLAIAGLCGAYYVLLLQAVTMTRRSAYR